MIFTFTKDNTTCPKCIIITKAIDIKDKKSALSVLVIPTDEELEIAMQTMMCVENSSISQ